MLTALALLLVPALTPLLTTTPARMPSPQSAAPLVETNTPSRVFRSLIRGSASGIVSVKPSGVLLNTCATAFAITSSRCGKNATPETPTAVLDLATSVATAPLIVTATPPSIAVGRASCAAANARCHFASGVGAPAAACKVSVTTPSSGMQTSAQTSQSAFALSVTRSPSFAEAGVCSVTRCIASPS